MQKFEDQNIEFKQKYTTDLRKEVLSFVNGNGGTVFIGVGNDGSIIGIDNPDEVMLQIANSLKDSLVPDIMPFVNIKTIEEEKKQIIQLDVVTGTNRPYYIREKGLKPSGGFYGIHVGIFYYVN